MRSFYFIPESECNVTVYYYSNARTIALYTTSLTVQAVSYKPESGGDYSITYHFTEVGSPVYIGGPDGDINIAGIAVSAAEGSETPQPSDEPITPPTTEPSEQPTAPPTADYTYTITSAAFTADNKLTTELVKNDENASGN